MKIERTPEFIDWFKKQTEKSKAQIDARLKNVELFNYFGDHKPLGAGLLEFRWSSGGKMADVSIILYYQKTN